MPIPSNDWASRLRPFAPLVVIAAAIATGYVRGIGLALLVLAAGALLLAIALVWQSVQSLGDEAAMTLDEALALGAPSAEEERKRSVLRALKDLDYERSVGKVSEDDYATLSAQYREEARHLLQILEGEQVPARARVEKLLTRRLERETFEPPKKAKPEAKNPPPPPPEDDEDDDENEEEREEEAGNESSVPASEETAPAGAPAGDDETGDDETDDDETDDDETDDDETDDDDDDDDDDEADARLGKKCDECETWNDPDARFCKSCGERFE